VATTQTPVGYAETGTRTVEARGGKYLTFHLAAEEFGLEILKVREIIGLMKITRIPKTPSYIRGVINLRGKVIPVLDLRLRFGMEAAPDTEQTCVIVVDMSTAVGSMMMGVVVDAVSEVQNINQDQIEAAPTIGAHSDTTFILGIAKIKNEVKILLDIDKVLTSTDFTAIESLAAPAKVEESVMA
jgi:purine-binding chemotaxis protein CheW